MDERRSYMGSFEDNFGMYARVFYIHHYKLLSTVLFFISLFLFYYCFFYLFICFLITGFFTTFSINRYIFCLLFLYIRSTNGGIPDSVQNFKNASKYISQHSNLEHSNTVFIISIEHHFAKSPISQCVLSSGNSTRRRRYSVQSSPATLYFVSEVLL